MSRQLAFAYGVAMYVVFLGTFLYAIGFVMDVGVPKSIEDGAAGPLGTAILVNVLLLTAFALQHSIMARPAFKRWWTRFVPKPVERSTFVGATCLVLGLIFWQWRPIGAVVWHVEAAWARAVLLGIEILGWFLVLYATFLIDHFDLFGLRQVWLYLKGRPYTHHPFVERAAYRWVRHPLMLGFIVAFWATPDMSGGRLLFAAVTTAYMLVAIRIEEHDLIGFLGEDYRRYRTHTPMIVPVPRRRPPAPPGPTRP